MKPLKTTLQVLFALSLLFFTLCDCDNPVIDPPPDPPYDGPWEKVTVPDDLGNYALDFISPNDGWVCGYANIGHWNGNSWSVVKRYGDSENKYFLSGIQAKAPNDIWVSGTIESGSPPYTYTGVIIHYNGNNWNEEQLSITDGVNSIHIFDDGTGWGGGDGIIYYDGSSWSEFDSFYVNTVFFNSKTDGWACGLSKIYRWDGTDWTESLVDYDVWFQDIDFASPDDGWAVSTESAYGAAGHYHWDGTDWAEFDDDTIDERSLRAVHFLRPDWGWAVFGYSYFFDGEKWERIPLGNSYNNGGYDIYCLSENDVWVSWSKGYFYHFTGFNNQN